MKVYCLFEKRGEGKYIQEDLFDIYATPELAEDAKKILQKENDECVRSLSCDKITYHVCEWPVKSSLVESILQLTKPNSRSIQERECK